MSYHLLIIDDDEDIQLILQSMLKAIPQLTIHQASTSGEALTALAEQAMDGVILDYRLPDASGEDILAKLQALPGSKTPYVVMLSARNDESLHEKWRQMGACEILTKPFNPLEMIARLRTTLGF